MAVKEVGRFVNTIHWQSDNSWQRELQRIKKYKKAVESAHEQIARTQYRASAGMIKAQQAQARAQEKIRKAALAAQMRSQKQLQTLERRMAREQARHNKMVSGVVAGRSAAKQRTITTMSGMKNMFSTATLNKYRASLQSLNAQYAAGGMSVSMYNQKLAALRNEMRATEIQARKLSTSMKANFKGAFKDFGKFAGTVIDSGFNAVAAGTVAAGGLTKMAMDNAANRHSAYYGLMAMNKDDKAATDAQMNFIRDISNAHGMDQKTAEKGYLQWAAATKDVMSERDRQGLFEAMAIKGRATGASGEQLQRAQVALSQIAGKNGQVYQEELKGQLAEALGGSIADFQKAYAESLGKTAVSAEEWEKAMKKGQVNLFKIMPYLEKLWKATALTKAYAESMKQPEIAVQRLKNAAYNASIALFGQIDATDGVYSLAEMVDDTAQSLTQTLQENKGALEEVGAGIAAFFARIQYGLGWFYEACKPIMEFFGVDTNNAKEVGDFLGKAALFFGALKAIKSVVGLLAPFATGFTKLIKAIVKGAALLGIEIPKPGKNKGPGKTTNKTGNGGGKGAVTAAIGEEVIDHTLNNKYQEKLTSSTDPMDQIRSKTGQTVTQRVETGDMGLLVASGLEVLRNSWNAAKNVPGKVPTWLGGTPRIPTVPTINIPQALPAPATGFNGVVPTQVMVESSGDINTKFELTVDENGLLRVVQKEVETAISWEKTKEINMFASPSY